ncbi:MAG: hypothetical protein HN348_07380, partial [Proteobacteria bacterium]|nr:hypothetical protein [Pseudomonadota bacterium]
MAQWALIASFVGLAACAARVDPLATDRERLLALAEAPPTEWESQAAIVVGDGLVDAILAAAVTEYTTDTVLWKQAGPRGTMLTLVPQIDPPDAHISSSPNCSDCLEVTIDWSGSIQADILGWDTEFDFEGQTDTTLKIATVVRENTRVLEVQPGDQPTTASLDFDLSEPYNSAIAYFVESQVVSTVSESLKEPIGLFELQSDGPVQLLDLRVRVEEDVVVEPFFAVLESGTARPLPTVDDEFAILLPAETLLGLVRAVALREEPEKNFRIEPTELHFTKDHFSFGVRVWKVARRPAYREYRVEGLLGLDDNGDLLIRADEAQEVDNDGWGGLVGALVKAKVLSYLRKGVELGIPGRVEQE